MFEELPVLRGITELEPIWDAVYNNGGVIAGGYARYCLSPTKNPAPASDIDVFPITPEAYEKLIVEIHHLGFNKAYENDVSYGFARLITPHLSAVYNIQVIKGINEGRLQTTGSIEKIIENFDFTVVRAALTSRTTGLVDPDFKKDEQFRNLVIKNIHCPVGTSTRSHKYILKGYTVSGFELLKLFVDWEGRDTTYREQLIDLLTEVENNSKNLNPQGLQNERLSDERRKLLYRLLRID